MEVLLNKEEVQVPVTPIFKEFSVAVTKIIQVLKEIHGVLLLLLMIIVLLILDILLDDAWAEEVFFHIEVTVVRDEYLSQVIDFCRVVIAEGISIAQPFGYEISCLTFNEKFFVGLPLECVHCLQEVDDVAQIFLEVLSEELINDIKYSSLSLIIELDLQILIIHHLPDFLFFLLRIIPSGIDDLEEFDEGADINGLLEELKEDVLDVPGGEPILHVRERVVNILRGLILLYDPEHEALDDLVHPE